MSPNDLHRASADPSGEAYANGEARQVSQGATPATHTGTPHPDGPSSSSHVLLNVDGSLAVTPEQIRYAQERRQRQDSLSDQMATVLELAIAHGCYDAQDWISRRFYGELSR